MHFLLTLGYTTTCPTNHILRTATTAWKVCFPFIEHNCFRAHKSPQNPHTAVWTRAVSLFGRGQTTSNPRSAKRRANLFSCGAITRLCNAPRSLGHTRFDVAMRRAATGVANCLREVSASSSRATPAVLVGRHGWEYGPSSTMWPSVHAGSGWTNSTTAAAGALAATPSHGRRLSSKSSSGKPTEAADETGSAPEKSLEVESTPVNTLVSSEGSSPSMLTGPRVKGKKGYLEREGMIRETQKAVREYYKAGMYQVRRGRRLVFLMQAWGGVAWWLFMIQNGW